jgi:outer membrane protein insertion porin family
VRVEGAHSTRKSFLGSLIEPFFPASKASPAPDNPEQTLESVLHTARGIAHRLHDTDIFKSVEVGLEKSRDFLAHEDAIDIVFKTREKGKFYLKTATEIGNGEGTAVSTFPHQKHWNNP